MFSERTSWRLAQNRFTQAVEEARARGAKLLDLTASNPTRVGLRYDSSAILGALCSERALDYDPQAKGLLSAREAVARYYNQQRVSGERSVASNVSAGAIPDKDGAMDPERIVLTASTSEGYSFVFRLLCNPGDELLVPKPSYPLFEFLADLQDVKLVPYPLIYDHGWQIDFHSLRNSITRKARAVVVVHPNNPTGSFVHNEERESLNAICHENGLAVVADEVFLDYGLGGASQASFVANDDVLSFTLSGVSKISALPQMKVAWVAASGPSTEVERAMERLEVIADTYLSMNAPIQWATPALLEQRHSVQRQLLGRVSANLAELDRQLALQTMCQRLIVEGGWYAVLRVPVTQSDEELAVELVRKESVLVHPGHFYDFPNDGHLVISLINLEEEFAEGLGRVLQRMGSENH